VRPPSASDSGLERFGCVPPPVPTERGKTGTESGERGAGTNPGAHDPGLAPVEPGPVRADGNAAPALVELRLRVTPRAARSGRSTLYRLVVQARRNGRWVPVTGARVRLAGIRARTDRAGVARIRARISRRGLHRANATAAAARPARTLVRVR
jgi:hypothetical protein